MTHADDDTITSTGVLAVAYRLQQI